MQIRPDASAHLRDLPLVREQDKTLGSQGTPLEGPPTGSPSASADTLGLPSPTQEELRLATPGAIRAGHGDIAVSLGNRLLGTLAAALPLPGPQLLAMQGPVTLMGFQRAHPGIEAIGATATGWHVHACARAGDNASKPGSKQAADSRHKRIGVPRGPTDGTGSLCTTPANVPSSDRTRRNGRREGRCAGNWCANGDSRCGGLMRLCWTDDLLREPGLWRWPSPSCKSLQSLGDCRS